MSMLSKTKLFGASSLCPWIIKHKNVVHKYCSSIGTSEKSAAIIHKNYRNKMAMKPEQPEKPKVLKVAIIGAPNAGKSTLLNQLMGWKIAPVSNKVHTTRKKTLGVLTEGDTQIVFLDTPGIIHPGKRKKHNLESTLVKDPHSSLIEADLIAVVIDVSSIWFRHSLDREVRKALYLHQDKESVLILNKIDLLKAKFELFKITKVLTEGVVNGVKTSLESKSRNNRKINLHQMFDKMVPGQKLKKNKELEFEHSQSDSFGDIVTKPKLGYEMSSLKVNSLIHHKLNKNHEKLSEQNKYANLSDKKGSDILAEESKSDDSHVDANYNERSDENEHIKKVDLEDSQVWHDYHSRLRKAEHATADRRGWDRFSNVYMVSAIDGDGVWDLKEKFIESAKPSAWEFHSTFITNQEPLELVQQCVLEKIMDHTVAEIPYSIRVQVSLFDEDGGLLRIAVDVVCPRKRHLKHILGYRGTKLRQISAEAKQALMNTFKQDLTLSVRLLHKQQEEM